MLRGPELGPKPRCDFIPTRIFKAAWSGFAEKWPAAYEIIDNYRLSTDQQEPLMGQVDVDGQTVEEAVTAFLDANEDYWKPIVDAATN